MKKLKFHETSNIGGLMWPPAQDVVDLNLPAVKVFTDFLLHKPEVVNPWARAVEAEAAMRREHAGLKLVVDDDERFLGVVSLEELNGVEIVKKVSSGFRRAELTVADFMIPKSSLRSLEYFELQRATLGDLVLSLQAEGQQYCLVVDRQLCRVRGVVSASEVARRVKLPLAMQRQSSFVDIFRAVHAVSH